MQMQEKKNGTLPGRPIPGAIQPQAIPGAARLVGKLSREEMLEMENLSLKVHNMSLQENQLQQDLVKANKMRHDFQEQLDQKITGIKEKWGVDITLPTTKLMPDGSILDQSPPQQALKTEPAPPPQPVVPGVVEPTEANPPVAKG